VKTEPIIPREWDQAEIRLIHSRAPFDIVVEPASTFESLVSVYQIRITLEVSHPFELWRALCEMSPEENEFDQDNIRELLEMRLQERLLGVLQGADELFVREEIKKQLTPIIGEVGLAADIPSMIISSLQVDVDKRCIELSPRDLEVTKMKRTYRRVIRNLVVNKQGTTFDDLIVLGDCTINAQGCKGTIWLKGNMQNNKMVSINREVIVKRSTLDLARMLMRIEKEGEL